MDHNIRNDVLRNDVTSLRDRFEALNSEHIIKAFRQTQDQQRPLLLEAIVNNAVSVETLKVVLQFARSEVNYVGNDFLHLPLMLAVEQSQAKFEAVLDSPYVNCMQLDDKGRLPLLYAIECRQPSKVEALFARMTLDDVNTSRLMEECLRDYNIGYESCDTALELDDLNTIVSVVKGLSRLGANVHLDYLLQHCVCRNQFHVIERCLPYVRFEAIPNEVVMPLLRTVLRVGESCLNVIKSMLIGAENIDTLLGKNELLQKRMESSCLVSVGDNTNCPQQLPVCRDLVQSMLKDALSPTVSAKKQSRFLAYCRDLDRLIRCLKGTQILSAAV